MSIITVCSGSYCLGDQFVEKLARETGYRIVTDGDITAKASGMSGIATKKIENILRNKPSVFNNITHERERIIAWLKLAIAETMHGADKILIHGLGSHLIPDDITHILRVCIIADMPFRVEQVRRTQKLSERDIGALLSRQDREKAAWTDLLLGQSDPWNPALYDLVIPMDKTTEEEALALITENLRSEVIQPTRASMNAAQDFHLAARIEEALTASGHLIEISARDGSVTLTINKNVLLLSQLEEELRSITEQVDGVKTVEIRLGKGYHKTDIYRKCDFETPKLLLVDDEREFVQTLSERLSMRDLDPAVVYNGSEALELLGEDDPEVMILDLRMPGIDGIEVLRKVKELRPKVEVIILTGHGSDEDKVTCIGLGAFAYLQKPVNIDVLNETIQSAYKAVRERAE